MFVPFSGRLGSGYAFLLMVYCVGVAAAIGIPAYRDRVVMAKLTPVVMESREARDKLAQYYVMNHSVPKSLDAAGVNSQLADGMPLLLGSRRMVLTAKTASGELMFVPSTNSTGAVVWRCINGQGLKPTQLPASCRQGIQ
jgi:hypothetical protein